MRKLFLFIAAALVSTGMWAETASWDFEANATGLTISDAGSASTARASYPSGDDEVANADGSYCIYANLGGTKGSSTTITTSDSYINIEQISMLLGTTDRGKTQFALQVSSKADFSSDVTDVQTQVVIKDNISAVSSNKSMATVTYNIEPAISGYVRIILAQTSNNKKIYVDNLSIKYLGAVTDPVTEVTIAGPTRGPKNYAATFTATTDVKADSYQWLVNGTEQDGATSKTFEFTPTATGDYSIVCKASNANNVTDATSDPIAFKALNTLFGELIKATLTSGSDATITGFVGGTPDVSLSSNKKMDDGKYFGITLDSGNFHEGDTVVITMTTAGNNYPCLFTDKERTTCLFLATETSSALEYKIVLPAAANSINKLYLSRKDDENYKWNPVLSSMSVIRPMATKSTVVDLTSVTIDEAAISSADLADLKADGSLELATSYVNAPTVVFNKRTTITYEDDSQKVTNDPIEVTASENGAGKWEAQATIGEVDYTITMAKTASVVVTYKFGERTLGTENVAIGGHPANYATYQTLNDGNLSTFGNWFNNADLAEEHKVTNMSAEVISAATTYYATFTYKYATSINFEKYTMANGKGQTNSENAIASLGTNKYASNYEYESKNLELDSLNNDKVLRNYDYLGLKVKKSGALLNFRLAKDATVKVKFGTVSTTPKVSINGGNYANMTITNKVYSYTAVTEGELISIKTADGNAVVFQQIAIGEELADPELFAITCAEAENGTVTNNRKNIAIPGETVTLTVTPAGGYQITAVKYNDGEDHSIEPVNSVYAFTMPDKAVTVTAEFSQATALDNTVDELKAVKFIENGKLFIRRGDKVYDAQGAVVK